VSKGPMFYSIDDPMQRCITSSRTPYMILKFLHQSTAGWVYDHLSAGALRLAPILETGMTALAWDTSNSAANSNRDHHQSHELCWACQLTRTYRRGNLKSTISSPIQVHALPKYLQNKPRILENTTKIFLRN
jgi:hypothetical protein